MAEIYLMLYIFILTIISLTSVGGNSGQKRPLASRMSTRIIHTQYGSLRGVLITLPAEILPDFEKSDYFDDEEGRGDFMGQHVEAYYGVQYGSILSGQLRFMPPTGPMEKWDGVKVAMEQRPACPQRLPDLETLEKTASEGEVRRWKALLPFIKDQQEECLALNIYVPARELNDTKLLPVLLIVHTETFDSGSGNALDGSVMAAVGHIVVVTINFRLGALGFLSTADSSAHGNYALLDLVAGLHYIRENIAVFGGDPQSVTLLGNGYGGAMVNMLLVSPVTRGKGLFHRVIVMGGSGLSSWATVTDPMRYTRDLALKVNCSHTLNHSNRLIQCLKTLPPQTLAGFDIRAPKYLSSFGPVVDGRNILPDSAERLMETSFKVVSEGAGDVGGKGPHGLESVDLLVALSGLDISDGASNRKGKLSNPSTNPEERKKLLRTYVQNLFQFHRQKIYDILAFQYTDWEGEGLSGIDSGRSTAPSQPRDLVIDGQFVAPLVKLAHLHEGRLDISNSTALFASPKTASSAASSAASKHQRKTYMFGFLPDRKTNPAMRSTSKSKAKVEDGGNPPRDLGLVMGAPLIPGGLSPFDQELYDEVDKEKSKIILSYWIAFIKSGDPNTVKQLESKPKSKQSNTQRLESSGSRLPYWPRFDLQSQQYIHLLDDATVQIGHHFRRSKMALWLELIPRIHKPDNLSEIFHQLDSFRNRSTYDLEAVDRIRLEELIKLYPQPPIFSSDIKDSFQNITRSAVPKDLGASDGSIQLSIVTPPSVKIGSRSAVESKNEIELADEKVNTPEKEIVHIGNTKKSGLSVIDIPSQIPLSLTIAVGCGLLALNLLVFCAIFRQRKKIGYKNKCSRVHTMDTGNETPQLGTSGDARVPETDSNSSLESTFSSKYPLQSSLHNAGGQHQSQAHTSFIRPFRPTTSMLQNQTLQNDQRTCGLASNRAQRQGKGFQAGKSKLSRYPGPASTLPTSGALGRGGGGKIAAPTYATISKANHISKLCNDPVLQSFEKKTVTISEESIMLSRSNKVSAVHTDCNGGKERSNQNDDSFLDNPSTLV